VEQIVVVLRCGEIEESQAWPLTTVGVLMSSDAWSPSALPGGIRVTLANTYPGAGSWAIAVSAAEAWPEDVTAEMHIVLSRQQTPTHMLWPRYEGVFERRRVDERGGNFLGAGRPGRDLPPDCRLALPLALAQSAEGEWVIGADPTFSTTLSVVHEDNAPPAIVFSWRWLAAAGTHGNEARRLFMRPVRGVRDALDRWFELATPGVPCGPAWLHEIALQDYDFLSKNGQGWYADIDAACTLIAPADRHRALFCLHGWYDEIGRYCYDAASDQLDENWTAFPYLVERERIGPINETPVHVASFPTMATHAFRNLGRYRPVHLSWPDLRDRLRYAKERGLRTAVYVLTGLQAAGSPGPHVADGTALDVDSPLWQGPDHMGPTHLLNPLHPAVRARLRGYVRALLEKIGDLTDALVMDEAYFVGYGMVGPPACPGYADRAQLTLIGELTALCHDYRPDVAFLTADMLGRPDVAEQAFPYSLYADGIYHDACYWPESWDCVRFPAWRNVAWSCNWAPVSG